MEARALHVLTTNFATITESNVDPACLAGKLLAAEIIGNNDYQRASNPRESTNVRLGELVDKVMRNGASNVFQTFVNILLREGHVKWLGEKLKGMTLLLA